MVSRLKWIVATVCLVTSFNVWSQSDKDKVTFKKSEITLTAGKVTKKIKVELAENPAQHEHGLMFRKSLPKDEGMLFIFPDEQVLNFWMKNTLINLSIGYFNKDKKLIDVKEMTAVTSIMQTDIPTYPSSGPAQYALEMPEGWFRKNNLENAVTLKLKGDK